MHKQYSSDAQQLSRARSVITLVYALQAASFLLAITFIAAVIVNYVKQDEINNTWLASHARWQIRTFWFALLWTCLGTLTLLLGIGYFILIGTAIWTLYRIIKGWLRLIDEQPMYQEG
ncbi:MAG: hypothetical protein COW18_02275 [Zetaproteobacteria bacterium CG12_big_fil_rev_8_21_14_0_65_54_13]|nr:MAG: hypothetical protein COW18_02275 [Zetaproteobacteria bacterium CG12_big_fil_rev_8_21_14_0_65_54_13]PIX53546.1 MAG: hypothetical protein COZ50_12970 [Zetaproteobacteria bacterium CG_4_10_14_3_um_filter_54_28]PJA28356.1 MAG: hypothetical protein CO188_10015 [Zetaproteobacteria bacterium CG_4_9_14_3_um_filter_54_145]